MGIVRVKNIKTFNYSIVHNTIAPKLDSYFGIIINVESRFVANKSSMRRSNLTNNELTV